MASPELIALVGATTLTDIQFSELTAINTSMAGQVPATDVNPQFDLGLQFPDAGSPAGFRVKVGCTINLPMPDRLSVAAVATYVVDPEAADLLKSRATMQDYINDVAVMAILPYIRQGLADVTQRVFRAPLLMPVLPRGVISFELPDLGTTGTDTE